MLRKANIIMDELSTFDFKEEDYEWLSSILRDENFKKWADGKMGLHGNQKGYGVKITESTIIGLLYEYKNPGALPHYSPLTRR